MALQASGLPIVSGVLTDVPVVAAVVKSVGDVAASALRVAVPRFVVA